MMRIWNYLKAHAMGLIVYSLSTAVSVFMGILVARMVNVAKPEEDNNTLNDKVDMRPSVTDSLLFEISNDVKGINAKIPEKKPVLKSRSVKRDTIKVDATIHLDQVRDGE